MRKPLNNPLSQRLKATLRAILSLVLLCLVPLCAVGQTQANDTINGTGVPAAPDDDFVRASLLVAEPGNAIYSVLGHAALRLQCPTHNLDFVFSEESEDMNSRVWAFFAGRLRMRVFALSADEYIGKFSLEGRDVNEYELNLPIAVKQRLWQQMDVRLKTSDGPYDYLRRSCALSVFNWLTMAVDADSLDIGQWPDYYSLTRRELSTLRCNDPWAIFFISTFSAGSMNDTDVPNLKKVLAPWQLVELLGRTTAYGRPIMASQPTHYPASATLAAPCCPWFTPLVASLLMLLISFLCIGLQLLGVSHDIPRGLHLFVRSWSIAVIALCTLLGVFVTYLVFFSDLTCTEWNWLIVPFNPLPVLLWHWRRHWLLPLAAVNLLWAVIMLLLPHEIVDPAHTVLAITLAAVYAQLKLDKRKTQKI